MMRESKEITQWKKSNKLVSRLGWVLVVLMLGVAATPIKDLILQSNMDSAGFDNNNSGDIGFAGTATMYLPAGNAGTLSIGNPSTTHGAKIILQSIADGGDIILDTPDDASARIRLNIAESPTVDIYFDHVDFNAAVDLRNVGDILPFASGSRQSLGSKDSPWGSMWIWSDSIHFVNTNSATAFTNRISSTSNGLYFVTGYNSTSNQVVTDANIGTIINTNATVASVTTNYFPMFIIPLGDGVSEWTDFEIKGTTNNFDSTGAGVGPDVVYLYVSSAQNATLDDRDAVLYFTDSGAVDAREWVKSPPNTSIASQLSDANAAVRYALFYPSTNLLRNAVTQEHSIDAIYEGNTNLFFSFVRYDGVNYEQDDAARPIWSPIWPTAWFPTHRDSLYDGGD